MKKQILFVLSLCSHLAINAYEFSFYNNTETPIGIAIQFTGNDTKEPLYSQLVKPKSMMIFTPGRIGIPDIKWGFCLDNVYFIENPTTEQKAHHFAQTPWRKIAITWVQEKSLTKRPEKAQSTAGKPKNKQPQVKEPYHAQAAKGATASAVAKSLCRDRHFDIIRDEHGKIVITSSLVE